MNEELMKAYNKIDNTLFLNNLYEYLKFGLDNDTHEDCSDLKDLVNSLIIVREGLLRLKRYENILGTAPIIERSSDGSFIARNGKGGDGEPSLTYSIISKLGALEEIYNIGK